MPWAPSCTWTWTPFFAAIEVLDNPAYRDKPLIVGGERSSRRGVVSTCSYEARPYGVRSAMPIQQAVKLCPHGIFIPGRMERYRQVSRHLHRLFSELTPLVEPVSIDEAFLDMTGCEHFYASLEAMGQTIKARIREEVRLPASVGIAPNKFLAKLASDARKPDGLVILRPEDVEAFLAPLPVGRLWGVGAKTEQTLTSLGIHTVGDLRRMPESWLTARFGRHGRHLHELARGVDERPVMPSTEAKSLGHERTFSEDVADPRALRRILGDLAAAVGARLRQDGRFARTVTLKVRYGDFETLTRSHTLREGFQDDDTLFRTADLLLQRVGPLRPVRLLGIYASHLEAARQLSLFEEGREDRLSRLMDAINAQLGGRVLRRGREGSGIGDALRRSPPGEADPGEAKEPEG